MITFLRRRLGVSVQMLANFLRKNRGKRRYIHPKLGVEGFFAALKENDIRYVVLRWFETLPHVEDGEDIDILVADEDIHRLEAFLTGTKSYGTPCDIYTVSGLPGTSYRGIAYFPEHLARELLDTARLQGDLVRVPDPRRHLFSMAYHAAYHKGYESGVPSQTGPSLPAESVDHDYPAVIGVCAERANMERPELTLEGLDRFLREHHWNPARDALEKLSARNRWVRDHFFTDVPEIEPHWHGFSVYILREKGLEHVALVRTMLFTEGFDILFEKEIDGEEREKAAKNLRGGNWSRGPWPASGGLPAYLFAVNDCFPAAPDKILSEKHPGLVNSRLLDTKIRIRDAVNRLGPRHERSNVIHSADNPHQGIEYFRIAVPDCPEFPAVEKRLREIHDGMTGRFPVIRELSGHGRRAKVELVRFGDGEAVCKTYRPGRERFLERELLAREMGKELPEMTPVLEHGENYLVLPFYNDVLDRKKPLPLSILRRTREIIRVFRLRGYELIDFKPKNIILDAVEGMKIIDFEFLQPGGYAGRGLAGNFCWYSIGEDFSGDVPAGSKRGRNNYYRYWFTSTALPLFFAVRDFPGIILVPVRFLGRFVISFYRLSRKLQNLIPKVRDRAKLGIIALLRKIM